MRDRLDRPAVVLAILLAAALPLLWPAIPPLTDVPGHIGRYHVMLAGPDSPSARWYQFEWRLVPNLGADLLIAALVPALGLIGAVKLVAVAVPVATVAAALALSRQVHGRTSPTALLAIPLAYNQAFLAGFLNFALAMAAALAALTLWLRWSSPDRRRRRTLMMVPIGAMLWIIHIYGWAVLGLCAFASELHQRRVVGEGWIVAAFGAAFACLPLAPPLLLMVLWRSNGGGLTQGFLDLETKAIGVATILRDRWAAWDLLCLGSLALGCYHALRSGWAKIAPVLLWCAAALALAFLLLPSWLFGSGLADVRLAPYALLLAVLALRPEPAACGRLAVAATAFAGARVAGLLLSMSLHDASYQNELRALDHLPSGVRLASLVSPGCAGEWASNRLDHLGGLAIARRDVFSNEQWALAGAPLVTIRPPAGAGVFAADPSQFLSCEADQLGKALARVPRDAFDYVWVIAADQAPPPTAPRLQQVWAQGSSALYRVTPPPR